MFKYLEPIIEFTFKLVAGLIFLLLLAIIYAMMSEGIPAIRAIGLWNFLSGTKWQPSNQVFGIFPMIISSLGVTLGAILLGVPTGLLVAIFINEILPRRFRIYLISLVNLMAAIPSVVYGFWGVAVIVPQVAKIQLPGNSMLAAILVVSLMIVPTMVSMSLSGLRSVSSDEKAASLALGEGRMLTVWRVCLPRIRSTLQAAVILAFGRAIGEATAVVLVAGNAVQIPTSLFDSVRTLTANTVMEMGYATGLHRQALMATGMTLFLFIILVNLLLSWFMREKRGAKS
ncbi:phosphate ABC transporter permease subunit PstC [Entomospira culicis]|uniref:Phosphate transport system permease protein n=1 Tax=Entomospira culicis TaxID=2719989 RepID=A0A968GFZ9_9SPIO|nr:phosphate ABC transporter permease subunit PstC [Entomospira culicis]NIZ19144.1 phosphate ABC transporter permease subunit PstC [Entomospira culicis]NIZ69358.1 phosphate ABC transporter permease subunit PstC [Entomospira culicis]WDI37943.1 phosphate ABC transporter permease subunit PstC [Entomospira culicis]WDI39571.1 phosphate ABC transporter permease subunit PstC [Entomospira culicis]